MTDWTVRFLGRQTYHEVFSVMRDFTLNRNTATQDELWFVEHDPVYTVGQTVKDMPLAIHDIPVVPTDRGGKITYHGPGQLVFYPLLNLKRRRLSPRTLVCALENSVLQVLSAFAIDGHRIDGAPGIYVDEKKIASLGLRIKNSCSYHGLSFNVNMDLTPFSWINPCGYEGLKVTQLKDLNIDTTMDHISSILISSFEQSL